METLDNESELFRFYIQKSPIPTAIYNDSGAFEFINDRFTDTYGYTLADLPDINTWWRLAYPDRKYRQEALALWKELNEKAAEGQTDIEAHQYQITCKNGRQCSVEIFGTRVGDKNIVHVNNVTEHIKTEAALKKSEAKFAKIFQTSPAVVGISTMMDHRYIDVNEAFERATGYSREEVIGRTIGDLGIWENPLSHENFLDLLKAQGRVRNLEGRFRSKNGRVLFGLLSAEALDLDGEECILWEIVDITERKRAEEILRKSEEKYSKIFQTSPAAIAIMGFEDGYLYEINPTFESLLGYHPGEMKGRSVIDLHIWADPKDRELLLQDLQNAGSVQDREYQFCTKDGRSINIRYSADLIDLNGAQCILSVAIDITERKRAEKEVQESEARYRAVFHSANDAIISADSAGNIVAWNPSAERIFGYKESEILGKPLTLLMPTRFREGQLAAMQSVYTGEEKHSLRKTVEVEGLCKDGSEFPAELSLSEWQVANGQFYTAIIRDITERKLAEENIIENEKRYRGLFENSPISLWEEDFSGVKRHLESLRQQGVTDFREFFESHPDVLSECIKEIKVLDVNAATLTLVHAVNKGQLLGNLNQVIITEAGKDFVDGFVSIAEGQTEFEWEGIYYTLDGEKLMVSLKWSAAPGYADTLEKIMVSVLDITERKKGEAAILRRAEELEALTQVSSAMRNTQSREDILPVVLSKIFYLFNGTGVVLGTYNPSRDDITIDLAIGEWANLTGRHQPVSDGITGNVYKAGQPYISDCLSTDDHFEWRAETNITACAACVPLTTNVNTIGVLWLGRRTPVSEKDFHLLTAIADMIASALQRQALHDDLQDKLIALQDAQAQMIQSEKLAAIGQLVSGVAHELNNPLTSVVLYSQLLEHDIHDEAVRKNVSKIVSEAIRAGKIVRGLLGFARQQPIKQEMVQVNDILGITLDLLGYELNAHDIKFELELFPELPKVMADSHQLTQVFVNLIQNAWQAMSSAHGNGHLKIVTEIGESIYPSRDNTREKMVRVFIKDDGPGIPEEVMTRIFDPFFTTKPEGSGTGLGLSICHGIVSEHKGHIWAESQAGMGATFIVELPVTKAIKTQPEKDNQAGTPMETGEETRILILDDEINIQDVLAKTLRRRGYVVDTTNNGADGLLCLTKTDYQLILCDIRMPGFNGLDFYKNVESRDPALAKRIIFITGDTANQVTQKFIEEHSVQYLVKPFELSDLLQVIRLVNDKQ